MKNLKLKHPVKLYDDGDTEVYIEKSDFMLKRWNGSAQIHTKHTEDYSEVHSLQAIVKFMGEV